MEQNERKEINTMRATGIIRRVDDLGRVVIPKEIRRTLRIHEGDPLEIFLDHDEITFKKYSFLGPLETYAKDFVQVMSQIFLMNAAICDMDTIIAYMGDSRYRCQEQRISEEVNRAIIERKTIIQSASQGHVIPLIEKACWTPKSLLLVPIMNLGETIGAIILFSEEKRNTPIGDPEIKACQIVSAVLSRQMEV